LNCREKKRESPVGEKEHAQNSHERNRHPHTHTWQESSAVIHEKKTNEG
jgi:hypothetical protein